MCRYENVIGINIYTHHKPFNNLNKKKSQFYNNL